jgi:hypothetical protein
VPDLLLLRRAARSHLDRKRRSGQFRSTGGSRHFRHNHGNATACPAIGSAHQDGRQVRAEFRLPEIGLHGCTSDPNSNLPLGSCQQRHHDYRDGGDNDAGDATF